MDGVIAISHDQRVDDTPVADIRCVVPSGITGSRPIPAGCPAARPKAGGTGNKRAGRPIIEIAGGVR